MALTTQVKRYLRFYSHASTIYSCHSPLSYEFASSIYSDTKNDKLRDLEALRSVLKKDTRKLAFQEYGAGSARHKSNIKTVAQIANSSLSGSRQCKQLYNLVKHYAPKTVLEMGTSLGISTAYLASGSKKSKIITLEGDPNVGNLAKLNFEALDLSNINLVIGKFEDTLENTLKSLGKVDMAFIDGNHKYQPTIDYFDAILPYTNDDSLLIFDDIYWSQEMKTAWTEIKNHNAVTMTIDLFHMGIVFLSKDVKVKQHLYLIEQRFKPWKIGLFGK